MKLATYPKLKSRKQEKVLRAEDLIKNRLEKDGVVVLPPMDVLGALGILKNGGMIETTTILDPWYNKGVGGVRADYKEFIDSVLYESSHISNHIYLWGFPEIVANFVNSLPHFELNAWLTWYYKNSPSVIRGWRSSQQACIHFCKSVAKLYPQH